MEFQYIQGYIEMCRLKTMGVGRERKRKGQKGEIKRRGREEGGTPYI